MQLQGETARAHERTAELEKDAAGLKAQAEADRLARVRIEQRIAPRLLTQEQQNDLTARLSQFKDVRGTLTALPSTPESEWFASVLLAPLHAAGWNITLIRGGYGGMILQPKGIIIQFPLALANSGATVDGDRIVPPPGPWGPLVDALNEFGIAAAAIPWPLNDPNHNIAIVISER